MYTVNTSLRVALATLCIFGPAVCVSRSQPRPVSGTRHYLYLSDQRIATAEVVNSQKIILNYINVGSAFEVVEAPLLVLVDAEGRGYRGHLIETESLQDPADRYQVSELVPPKRFKGLTVRGDFRLATPAAKVFLRLGGRILELEAMLPEDFEAAAAAIGNVDLSTEDAKAALVRVGFRRGYGNLYFAGSPEARTAEDLTPDYEVLAPVLLDSVRPRLPASVDVKGDSVVVELSVLVGKAGGLYDIQLIATPHADLAPIAEETVRNAWRFLPAVSQGKPVDARVTLKVTFQR
jgi:hypothetical protein